MALFTAMALFMLFFVAFHLFRWSINWCIEILCCSKCGASQLSSLSSALRIVENVVLWIACGNQVLQFFRSSFLLLQLQITMIQTSYTFDTGGVVSSKEIDCKRTCSSIPYCRHALGTTFFWLCHIDVWSVPLQPVGSRRSVQAHCAPDTISPGET